MWGAIIEIGCFLTGMKLAEFVSDKCDSTKTEKEKKELEIEKLKMEIEALKQELS